MNPTTTPDHPTTPPGDTDTDFHHIVNQLTRRGLLTGTLGAATALALAACAHNDTPSTGPDGGTRRVKTIHGGVEVPARPRRVVAVSFVGTANLLDLGVTLIGGVTGGVEFLPRFHKQLASLPIVADSAGKVNLEKVAALNPDLIVGSDWPDPSQALLPYDKLRQIAPTALFEQAASVGNWTEQAQGYADAANRMADLSPLQQKLSDEQSRIRTTYADLLAGLRWEIVNAVEDSWYRYSTAASHCKILAGAGFRFTTAAESQKEAFAEMSYEELAQLQPASAIGVGRSIQAGWESKLTGQKLFQQLPAVQADHVVSLRWFFPSSYGTALALLTQIEPTLAAWKAAR